jgi:argininosuccinate lyase
VRSVLTVTGALQARSAVGGTAPDRVAEQLAELADVAHGHAAWARGDRT